MQLVNTCYECHLKTEKLFYKRVPASFFGTWEDVLVCASCHEADKPKEAAK